MTTDWFLVDWKVSLPPPVTLNHAEPALLLYPKSNSVGVRHSYCSESPTGNVIVRQPQGSAPSNCLAIPQLTTLQGWNAHAGAHTQMNMPEHDAHHTHTHRSRLLVPVQGRWSSSWRPTPTRGSISTCPRRSWSTSSRPPGSWKVHGRFQCIVNEPPNSGASVRNWLSFPAACPQDESVYQNCPSIPSQSFDLKTGSHKNKHLWLPGFNYWKPLLRMTPPPARAWVKDLAGSITIDYCFNRQPWTHPFRNMHDDYLPFYLLHFD